MFAKIKEDTTHIRDLEALLKGSLGERIVKHDVKPLTDFGENYGSEILSVKITVEENGQEKEVQAVAKLIPPTELQLEIFNTQVTFKNEIGFYAETVPALDEFQRENGISPLKEFVPRFFGARVNLNPDSTVVDNDGAIIMENLKFNGYDTFDRLTGFDLNSAKVILRILAGFQATTLALRKKKPEVFKSKIEPYLKEWKPPNMFLNIDIVLKENPGTSSLIPRVQKLLAKKRFKKTREPWATITHNDLWVNNIMVKESNGVIDDIKFVDFQIHDYGSPAVDVLFFLFTSVETPVLQFHFEKLLQYYYKEFIQVLQSFKLDIKDFTYESFKEELNQEAAFQCFHALFMLVPILKPKGQPKRPGKAPEWNPNGVIGTTNSHTGPPANGDSHGLASLPQFAYTLTMKEKTWFIVTEAAKRNWL